MQVVLCEAGLLRQTLQLFVSHLRPMLAKEFNVHGAFVPFLQSLADEPALASAHAVHMAVALLSMHLNGCEVSPMEPHGHALKDAGACVSHAVHVQRLLCSGMCTKFAGPFCPMDGSCVTEGQRCSSHAMQPI